MSTVEDFENAPVGATATSPDGGKAVKTFDTDELPWLSNDSGWCSSDDMSRQGFTIDPTHPAPTTAQEALDLAWELAHPVEEGQEIPEGTHVLFHPVSDDFSAHAMQFGFTVTAWDSKNLRTLDPLSDQEPGWLDAPAVIAFVKGWISCADPQVFVRENKDGTQWVRDTKVYRWDELIDVTPLYPKEQDA